MRETGRRLVQTLTSRAFVSCVIACIGLTACQHSEPFVANPAAFSIRGLHEGIGATQAQCASDRSAVWIVVKSGSYCIRYYAADATGGGRSTLFYIHIHGDIPLADSYGQYSRITPSVLIALSRKWNEQSAMRHYIMARPGTFGSSGHHYSEDRSGGWESSVMGGAIDRIKARHGLGHIAGGGQSGGGMRQLSF